nr:amidase family protein [Listeria rustica]
MLLEKAGKFEKPEVAVVVTPRSVGGKPTTSKPPTAIIEKIPGVGGIKKIVTPRVEIKSKSKVEKIVEDTSLLGKIDKQLKTIDIHVLEAKEKLVVGADISQIQQRILSHELTYEELVGIYLNRIKKYDLNGPKLNAITEINADVLAEARKLDATKAYGNMALYGMPVLLKDNIGTEKLPTSAGSVALRNWVIGTDAPLVKALKTNGALILGKTNMSEWANYMSEGIPNGYSGKQGQVKNPYLDIDPFGSSTGSAVAAASDFAAITIGTETNGSIIAPSAIQSVVGFKPSLGTVSNALIIPLSSHFDTPGPITKSVKDAYFTTEAITNLKMNTKLSTVALKGRRVGLMFDEDYSDSSIQRKIVADLKAAGAIIVREVGFREEEETLFAFSDVLRDDFKRDLNQFLKGNKAPYQDLAAIIAFNETDKARNMKYGQSNLLESQNSHVSESVTNEAAKRLIEESARNLNQVFQAKKLDAIITINSDNIFTVPIAGFPELTIPAGYNEGGSPVGATFIGLNKSDANLLAMGYAYEQQSKNRRSPKWDTK